MPWVGARRARLQEALRTAELRQVELECYSGLSPGCPSCYANDGRCVAYIRATRMSARGRALQYSGLQTYRSGSSNPIRSWDGHQSPESRSSAGVAART